MTSRAPLVAALVLVFAVAAHGQTPTDPDAKEIQNFRLTLEGLKQFAVAVRNMVTAAKADPRYEKLMTLKSELERLQEKEELTEAEQERVEKLQSDIEAVEDSASTGFNMSNHKTLSDMEAAIRKEPLLANALKSAGMSPRDYAKFTLAFFQAAMIHGMQKSGLIKEIPKDLQATVNMDNVKFMETHQAEIQAIMAELQTLSKQ